MVHDLRAVLRFAQGRAPDPSAVILDARTLQSTPESGARAGYDGAKRRRGSKVHAAVDTLGHLLALSVTPATADDRTEVARLRAKRRAIRGLGGSRRSWDAAAGMLMLCATSCGTTLSSIWPTTMRCSCWTRPGS